MTITSISLARRAVGALLLGAALSGCSLETLFPTDLRRKTVLGDDSDGDGISDRDELIHGLDPGNEDTDGNGIPDGDEDPDGDGLSTTLELKFGFDPWNPDSASSIYGEDREGNGVNDCDEDIDGDGAGSCWEIKFSFDPESNSDVIKDDDGDGFANAEEFPDFDPSNKDDHPGAAPLLIAYDDDKEIEGRTNAKAVRGTFSYCNDGDELLFTGSDVKPVADDEDFVACTTEALALSGKVRTFIEGEHTVYVWRKNAFGVVETPIPAKVVVDKTGPKDGALVIEALDSLSITLAITTPPAATNKDYVGVELFRFEGVEECEDTLVKDGVEVTLDSDDKGAVDAEGLVLGMAYCYRAIFSDDVGNEVGATVLYDGIGPDAGELEIASLTTKAIHLTHTPPSSDDYAEVSLVRFEDTECAESADADGTALAMDGLDDVAIDDTGLELATAYCYKISWRDAFGNGPAVAAAYDGTGPDAGTISLALAPLAIDVTLVAPADPEYASVTLARYDNLATCADKTEAQGAAVTVTAGLTANDPGLSLETAYCYRAFWKDDFGNVTAGSTAAYDGNGPTAGTLAIASLAATTVNLTLTAPADPEYASVTLAQYDSPAATPAACAALEEDDAGAVPVAVTVGLTAQDGPGLLLETSYCYRAFWKDTFGNVTGGSTVTYDGTGPTAGSIAISSYAATTINLTLTAPSDPEFDTVTLAQYDSPAGSPVVCSNLDEDDPGAVAVAVTGGLTASDAGLALDTNYCYRAFWKDDFGNVTAGGTTAYDGVGPTAGTIAVSSIAANTVNLTLTAPADPTYATVTLKQFDSPAGAPVACAALAEGDAGAVGVTVTAGLTASDTGLALDTNYCYRPYWKDTFGNSTGGSTATYDGVVTAGVIDVTSVTFTTITFSHTPSADTYRSSVTVRKDTGAGCPVAAPGDGSASVAPATVTSTSFTDTGLSPGTTYCYTAFWYDSFGNFVAGSPDVDPPDSATSGQSCDADPGNRSYFYPGEDVVLSFTCNTTIASVTNSTKPAWLTQNAPSGSTVTYGGIAAAPGADPWSFTINGAATAGDSASITTTAFAVSTLDSTSVANPGDFTASRNIEFDLVHRLALDGTWDGDIDDVTLATASVATDMHGISTTVADCNTAPAPRVCTYGSSNDGNHTLIDDLHLQFTWSAYDQGTYYVAPVSEVTFDAAVPAVHNAVGPDVDVDVTVPIQAVGGNTPIAITGGATINYNTVRYTYGIAVHPSSSTPSLPVVGVIHIENGAGESARFNRLTIDRTYDPLGGDPFGIDQTTAAGLHLDESARNCKDFSLMPYGVGEWLALGTTDGDVYAVRVSSSATVPVLTTSAQTLTAYNPLVYSASSTDMTAAFTDPNGPATRVGAAFSRKDVAASKYSLRIVKFNPDLASGVPGMSDDADYIASGTAPSLPAVETSDVIDRIKIRVDADNPDRFYVAYRQATELRVASVLVNDVAADYGILELAAPEAPFTTAVNETLDMAIGEQGGSRVLGIVYRSGADTRCYFLQVAADLSAKGTPLPLSTNACYMPTVHFGNSGRFLVTFDEYDGANHDIKAAEITVGAFPSNSITHSMTVAEDVGVGVNAFTMQLVTAYYPAGEWIAMYYRIRSNTTTIRFHGYHPRGR
jgi:hypothetical protein